MKGERLKTGIFSGSFNPVHIGHLALANYLCEFEGMDEVWFVVTPHNPLKEREELMDDNLRLEMVRIAIDGYPRFCVSDIEFHLPRPSYTVNTLHALSLAYPERSFYFIMGADNWENISRWKDSEVLLHQYSFLVYPRRGHVVSIPESYSNVRAVHAPLIEISSTFIRHAIREGKDIRFILPAGIYNRCVEALCEEK